MGNANGREDANGSGSGSGSGSGLIEEEEGEEEEEKEEEEMIGTATVPTSTAAASSSPHTPGAAHSPLMFAPQPPVAPIQKPDELNIPNPSWLPTPLPQHHALFYDDHIDDDDDDDDGDDGMAYKQGIPTMITWTQGGRDVSVEGSWDNWRTRKPLQRSGKDFTLMKVLPSGVYQFRFIVDGSTTYAPDIPHAVDESGSFFNVLDLQDYVPEDTESISGFEPPQSPDGSYNNSELNQEDFAKEPPLVPPHLNLTLLNVSSLCTEVPPPSLSRPQHVVLNHLYMQKGRSGSSVVALGSTHRFKAKYVTVVLYKSL